VSAAVALFHPSDGDLDCRRQPAGSGEIRELLRRHVGLGDQPRNTAGGSAYRTGRLGLRVAELLALRVEDIDFLHRAVRVEWQTSPDGKRRTLPKTPRSRRTLPLPIVVADALAAHIAEYPPAGDGSLFTTATGLLYRHEHYGSRIFAKAVRTAGLPAGTTSHHLRHHFASALLAAGESVVAVAERLGHENGTRAQDVRASDA
jgi:integrase